MSDEPVREPMRCEQCNERAWQVAFYFKEGSPIFICKHCLIYRYDTMPEAVIYIVRPRLGARLMFTTISGVADWLLDDMGKALMAEVRKMMEGEQ